MITVQMQRGKTMAEYIYEIESDEANESEIFVGWIRNHSKELIRCKDCKWNRETAWVNCPITEMFGRTTDNYCSRAERKEE